MFCHSESIFVGKLLLLCCVTVFEDRVEDGNILAGPSKECQKRKPKICPDLAFFFAILLWLFPGGGGGGAL